MNRKNVARNALFTSIISLLLCVSMLVGTTFAWFTDSVTSANNVIASGNLDVELYYSATGAENTWEKVGTTTDVFGYDLWEPGYTKVVYFKVVNEGSLALKYKLSANVGVETPGVNQKGEQFLLSNHLRTAILKNQTTRDEILELSGSKLNEDFTMAQAMKLAPEAEEVVAMAIWMPTDVGNEANHNGETVPAVNFTINLVATQLDHENEKDSFGSDYDSTATLPGISIAPKPADGVAAVELEVRDNDDAKVASFTVPAAAVADNAENLTVKVEKTSTEPNFTVATDKEVQPFEITVSGLKDGNTEMVKVELRIEAGKDPATVELYHKDVPIPCTYNPNNGYVSFETDSFSPFFVVYDAESEYKPDIPEGTDKPEASVVESPEYVNTELPWGSYGQWSPTEGLDANLEAAYTFACVETPEEAKLNPYANWYCDFYVSLDKDLGENELFLGGNYGSFGWVGFHNGDVTLEANTEIGLLESVTTNPWTYLDVATYVGEFICGVGDVNDALKDATFTVMLRLTNPDNADEYYDIETINYKFQ